MNESDTRLKKIDPALRMAGWGNDRTPGSDIFTEQRAYLIAPGRVEKLAKRNPDKVDYLLTYKGKKIGVIEAKSDEKPVNAGVEQAKRYADMLKIRFTYSTNGDEIYQMDMETGEEGEVPAFPTPKQLWRMTFPTDNALRDRFNECPFNTDRGKSPRYYQEVAVNKVLEAIAGGKSRLLITLATGTGKTYIAFQICWKLMETRWNLRGDGQQPRILFLTDRNILANQAMMDFDIFPQEACARLTPAALSKADGKVPTGRSLYFTIFQTFMTGTPPCYTQYPRDFFDLIIIDECHRGGANDESQWRQVMDYFEPAVQLGMTATPKTQVNANTYRYFGDPLYEYSLKQGIMDGYLTPFRVEIFESNVDEYQYHEGDDVEGDIDPEKTYTETDFYQGRIEMRERDEARVKKFLDMAEPDDKAIVFCYTQNHAMQIRDMINRFSHHKHSFYCVRVTANDGEEGEAELRKFQDNDKTIPTILTTSRKLSTGVDARNVRNIVLMRPIKNIVEFKQIIGRGTRLFDHKYYFTIYDFVRAYEHFKDPDWDGDVICPVCGNYPCTCHKKKTPGGGNEPRVPKPCPICGNLPCTCPKPSKRIKVTLRDGFQIDVKVSERFMFADKLITMAEFIEMLFGSLPDFFHSEEDLRQQWSNPESRKHLLTEMENAGFVPEKLDEMRRLISAEDCDLYDVLQFLAYHARPVERQLRAEKHHDYIMQGLNEKQQQFIDFVLSQYVAQGFEQLSLENIPGLVQLKYGSVVDAARQLGGAKEINRIFTSFQQRLYAAL